MVNASVIPLNRFLLENATIAFFWGFGLQINTTHMIQIYEDDITEKSHKIVNTDNK